MKKVLVDGRVLHFSCFASSTGVGRYLSSLIAALIANDKEASYHLVTGNSRLSLPHLQMVHPDISLSDSHTTRLMGICSFLADADLIFSPLHPTPRRRRCPAVLTVHDIINTIGIMRPEIAADLGIPGNEFHERVHVESLVRSIPDHIIAVSRHTKKDILQYYPGIKEENVSVIYSGASLSTSKEAPEKKPADLLNSIPGPYILSIGAIEPRKNLMRLFQAYAKIRRRNPGQPLFLVFAGPMGWSYQTFLESINKSPFRKEIILAGYVSDSALTELLKGAELLAFPSLYEGFGLPVVEAMALGCPVVASDAASLPEIGDEAAIYFDPWDVDSIAHAVEKVLSDRALRAEMCRKGKRRAKLFTWERAAEQTRQVFARYW